MGLASHPYALQLHRQLQQHIPSTKIEISIDALAGDQVVNGQYFPRLNESSGELSAKKYDWIIVQGGGNDLRNGRNPEEIFRALKAIWKNCLDRGLKVIALTVTETAAREETVLANYEALNQMILSYREHNVTVADVCRALPWPASKAEQNAIWDDGLHFLPRGYDVIGSCIADVLLSAMGSSAIARAKI